MTDDFIASVDRCDLYLDRDEQTGWFLGVSGPGSAFARQFAEDWGDNITIDGGRE